MNIDDPKTAGGCCGCLLFPSILALSASALFWFSGFTTALLLHGAAALIWAATRAVGHVLFGWPVPTLSRRPDRDRRLER